MSNPNLPLITLRRGPWLAEVFDPRPSPTALGARFVHGGWVRRLLRDGRDLTGSAVPAWHPYDGLGIPETFETGFGWHLVEKGQEYLRIGAGRLVRSDDDPSEETTNAPLSGTLEWQVEAGPEHVVFRTNDTTRRYQGPRFSYQLERTLRLVDDGLVSTTTLTVEAMMARMLPVSWYAHPFFAQTRFDGTAFALPAAARLMPKQRFFFGRGMMLGSAVRGDDGLWRLEQEGGRAVFGGLWGSREPSRIHLDGGGVFEVAVDAPLDHIVLWASACGASIEPKLARTWVHGETATWSIAYRWR